MISTNISTLRKRFNMTQEEVAEKINVSRQALAKWERGIAMIPQRALTDLLGLVTGKIFAGKEDKKEKRKK